MQSAAAMPQQIQNPAYPDPFARLAWLEREYQVVFQDASRQFAQNQQLLKEKQEWAATRDRMAKENETMLHAKNAMSKSLYLLKQDKATFERQKATQNQRIQSLETESTRLKSKNAALNAENVRLKKHTCESKESRYSCWDCGSGLIISSEICGCCFRPVSEWDGGSKGSTKVVYDEWDGPTSTDVSDSEGESKPDPFTSRMREQGWDRNIQRDTRLDEGAFDWLLEWCEKNIDRIERRRALERRQNGHEVRRCMQDLRDNREELDRKQKEVGKTMKIRRQIKRKIRALTDDDPLVSENGLSLEQKLFVFCMVMGAPNYDFKRAWYPWVKNEKDLVKIYDQVMGAMRVLHHDLVEAPKAADPKFKHRNPSPAKWMVLKTAPGPTGSYTYFHSSELDGTPLEQSYASNEKEARMACTALQNLLYRWQEDTLD